MIYIELDGVQYRSIREACHKLGISYEKVKRLCRHFQRAAENPVIALEWCLNKQKFIPSNEKKTHKYKHDKKSHLERQNAYIERRRDEILKYF